VVGARLGPSIAAIERQCGRMERLVQNLLVLTRIRSDTLRLYPTEVELAPLVERVARQMAAASMEHDVRTELAAAPRAHADPERLAMAVRNEIEDALRLAPPGTPVIVRLAQIGRDANIGVGHHPRGVIEAVVDETIEERHAEGELGVNRHVSEAIVAGHGGTLREERTGEELTTWIRLPAITELHGDA
jgi:signal transduction histidine kinase